MAAYTWYSTGGDNSLLSVITGCDIEVLKTAKERLAFLCGEYMANKFSADIANVTNDPLLAAAVVNHLAYRYDKGSSQIQAK